MVVTLRLRLAAPAVVAAALGLVAVAPPASAAESITVTLSVVISEGNSVAVMPDTVALSSWCNLGFVPGQRKNISVTVPAGEGIQVVAADGCYTSKGRRKVVASTQGQVIDVDFYKAQTGGSAAPAPTPAATPAPAPARPAPARSSFFSFVRGIFG